MTKVTHLDHIAIVTENLQASIDFYQNVLGQKCTSIEEIPTRGIKIAMIPVGNCRIELIEPLHENSEVSNFLKKKGAGIHHIALATNNINQDMEKLKNEGVKFTTNAATKGAHDTSVAFIHPKSSGGVLIELVDKS
ncbi:MAG: methylmalonyl-CoA epimerase [bacterium]|nr:methylmalonyl-CoA epimerase [bacterium]